MKECSPVGEDVTVISVASLDTSVMFDGDGAPRSMLESP
jgi:hypothetical protein